MRPLKAFDVCGLGNALVDILVEIDEDEFAALRLERGTMRLVNDEEQAVMLGRFQDRGARLVSGGSVGNSIIAIAQLGGKPALVCCLGDDRYGIFYKSELESLNVETGTPLIYGASTGTCLALITPDAERTMRTNLGVTQNLTLNQEGREMIARSEWLFIEGYIFANPGVGVKTVQEAAKTAKGNGCKIALTCSEAFIVEGFREPFLEVAALSDLLLCNLTEAQALSDRVDVEDCFSRLCRQYPGIVVTCGERGAWISYGGQHGHVPAFPCLPVDLTGAGDMFAGGFLYGITHGYDALTAARAGCFLAMQVITRHGARLDTGVREHWDSVVTQGP